MADERLRIVIDALNKASDDLVKVKRELGGIDDTLKNADKSSKNFGQTWAGVLTGINSGIMIAQQAAAALKKVYDTAREGAELEYAETKFDNLSRAIGTTSDALMGDLREATRGMYSDAELMASAGDMMGLGLAKTHDEAVRLSRVAAALNMNMNQLTLTLTNKTTMRFDTLGVKVAGFDDRLQDLIDTGMDADEAFGEAFLQQAEEQIETVGEAADTSMGAFMQFEAAIKNAGDSAKKSAANNEILKGAIGALTDQLQKENDFYDALDQALKNGIITQDEYTKTMRKTAQGSLDMGEVTADLRDRTDELNAKLEANAEMNRNLVDPYYDAAAAARDLKDAEDDLSASLDTAEDALKNANVPVEDRERLMWDLKIAAKEATTQERLLEDAVGALAQAYADDKLTAGEYLDGLEELKGVAGDTAGELFSVYHWMVMVQQYADSKWSGIYTGGGYSSGGGPAQGGAVVPPGPGAVDTSGAPTGGPTATGGPVSANNPYMWQEYGYRGERLVPSQDGFVLSRADAKRIVSEASGSGQKIEKNYYLTMPTSSNPADLVTAFEIMEAFS